MTIVDNAIYVDGHRGVYLAPISGPKLPGQAGLGALWAAFRVPPELFGQFLQTAFYEIRPSRS
jgi:hypothetical protein